jgi:hypothetical protein
MSDEIGTYSFLPWLRQGLSNQIDAADLDPAVKLRATIPVSLDVKGQPLGGGAELTRAVSRNVALYGPGDIVGIDKRTIVDTVPKDGAPNFEPNYFAHIVFYDEDFPWRYTPAKPDLASSRLRPWIVLVVLAEGECEERPAVRQGLPDTFILNAQPEAAFPPSDQLWAWAHVHVNKDLIQDGDAMTAIDVEAAMTRFQSVISANPDHAYSRLLCPRKLQSNVRYTAFVVPGFELGRLAGIGLTADPANAAQFATQSAWAAYTDRPQPTVYPFYHRWSFKTGDTGDFESLVRLLKPRPPDARLGRRDIDVLDPGSNIAGIDKPGLNGVLRLEGALRVPKEALSDAQEAEAQIFEDWDLPYPHAFQQQLAAFINLADDYSRAEPADAHAAADALPADIQADPDPLITPPLYGRWHALTDRLLAQQDGSPETNNRNWVHETNLDPRWRVSAGFGTAVVQDKQEELMDAAWGQVGQIVEANRRIREAQVALETTWVWYDQHLASIKAANEERLLFLTTPVQRRVIVGDFTARHQIDRSVIPRAVLSPPMRRIVRPRDHFAARLGFGTAAGPERLLDRINAGEVSASPPKVTPEALPTVEEVAADHAPTGLAATVAGCLQKHQWLLWLGPLLVLLIAVLLLASGFGIALAGVIAVGAIALYLFLTRALRAARRAAALTPAGMTPAVIDALPTFPGFELREPVLGDPPRPEPQPGAGDSPAAAGFKAASKDVGLVIKQSAELGKQPVRPQADLAVISETTFTALDPAVTIPTHIYDAVNIPGRITAEIGESFREAMAYPAIDTPMYKPLTTPTVERFLPGIKHLPPNTITLLEPNQRFIEAYMLGLNHEFARELLWREYPTDQRGSYFRQFWDVAGAQRVAGLTPEQLREKLRDIPPIHRWSLRSELGQHDHRDAPGESSDDLVLVIRGELLRRYPTAVIYAQRARWPGDVPDKSKERIFETRGNMADLIKLPIYEAEASPDVYFRGFDISAADAQGGDGTASDPDPGWFFVIKEREGEPRFGLDEARDGALNVWNDLAWPDVYDAATDGNFLKFQTGRAPPALEEPTDPALDEKVPQYKEDKAFSWRDGTNAAELAYILYQAPVLVAVHASVMLPD